MSHKNDDTWTPIPELVVKSHRAENWMGQFACKALPGKERRTGFKQKETKLNGAIAQRAMKWDFLDGNGMAWIMDWQWYLMLPQSTLVYKRYLLSCVKICHLSFFSSADFPCSPPTQQRNPLRITLEWRDRMIDVSRESASHFFFNYHKSSTNT